MMLFLLSALVLFATKVYFARWAISLVKYVMFHGREDGTGIEYGRSSFATRVTGDAAYRTAKATTNSDTGPGEL